MGAARAQKVAVVFISAPSSQVTAHDSVKLTATAFDSSGNAIPSAQFTWSVSDTTAFTIDSTGTVHAVGLGWSDIYATSSNVRGTLRLQVVPLAINVHPANQTVHVGDTVSYSADVLDVNSQPMQGVPLFWRAYGANGGTNNGISIDRNGTASTYGYGTFFIEAYYTYTVGGGSFIQNTLGNTLLTVKAPNSFTQIKLLDSGAVRQGFALRQRRGLLSVNDAGQISYVGWLEGFATSALLWNPSASGGSFTPILSGGVPAELPGSTLIDMDDLSLNNNGEVSTRCIVAPIRNCILFAGQDGIPHMIFFDGGSGAGVTNIRNFNTTRFGLNDYSSTLFRADYYLIGQTTTMTGLFTISPSGNVNLAVAGGTSLPGLGTTYTFDRDFGLQNDGTILFFATSGASRALYRVTPDGTITRVIGTGDTILGGVITSLGNVATGKNGQYAVIAYNGANQVVNLYNGDPSTVQRLASGSSNTVYNVSGKGEVAFLGNLTPGYGLYRWNGSTATPVFLTGQPSPTGDAYIQFDSAGITAKGEVIAQARTANNLLMVVNSGVGPTAKPSIVFQTGAQINVSAGPSFYNLVLNGHTGNPMIKTGWYTSDIFEVSSGQLIPRMVNGDRLPGGWFYEGNDDERRNANGDLFVSTDDSFGWIGATTSTQLAHFPQLSTGGNLYAGYQIGANSQGAVVMMGGTSFGTNHLSVINPGVGGTLSTIAWLGSSSVYKTASPGGGTFSGSNDVGIADDNTVYASLNVNSGSNGIFAWTQAGGWTAILKIGDPYDGRNVTSIGTMRVAGTACYAYINTTNGFFHIARYQNGAWTDVVSYGDAIPAGGNVSGIGAFDANRKGGVAVNLYGGDGVQYLSYINGATFVVAGSNDYLMSTGEFLPNFFQVGLNDDGRIFATAINSQDLMVLYEFDPLF